MQQRPAPEHRSPGKLTPRLQRSLQQASKLGAPCQSRAAPSGAGPPRGAGRYVCGGSRRHSESERSPPALRRTAAAPRPAEPEAELRRAQHGDPRGTRRGEVLPRPQRSPRPRQLRSSLTCSRRSPRSSRGTPIAHAGTAAPSPLLLLCPSLGARSSERTRPEGDRWDPARRSSGRLSLPRALPGAGSRVRSVAGREGRRREGREQSRSRPLPPSPARTQAPPPAGPAFHWLRQLGPGGARTPYWQLALSRNRTARPHPTACRPPPSPGGGRGEGMAERLGVGLGGLRRATGGAEGRSVGVPQSL